MATMNFSLPEEVKVEFDRAFEGENKSALITRLLQQAIEERKLRERRALAINRLLALRRTAKPTGEAAIRKARTQSRR